MLPGSEVVNKDWRDTLRRATDLALVGIIVTVASLPVVTAGAALSAGSEALSDWLRTSSWPSARVCLRRFTATLLPGALATLAVLLSIGLLLANLVAVGRGVVPGGPLVAVLCLAVLVLAFGLFALALVFRGRGFTFRAALLAAWRAGLVRPTVVAALGLVVLLAAFLATVLPVCAPLLVGYTLFGVHVVAARLLPATTR